MSSRPVCPCASLGLRSEEHLQHPHWGVPVSRDGLSLNMIKGTTRGHCQIEHLGFYTSSLRGLAFFFF